MITETISLVISVLLAQKSCRLHAFQISSDTRFGTTSRRRATTPCSSKEVSWHPSQRGATAICHPFLHSPSVSKSTTRFLTDSNEADAGAGNENDDDNKPTENPYADPNYPDLEFVNYSDQEYQVDIGDEFAPAMTQKQEDSTEQEIEAMREERRKRNDEYQFQTYYTEILKEGDEYKGEWTIYKTSTFLKDVPNDETTGLPRLVKSSRPIKVISKGYKIQVEYEDKTYAVDSERIIHEEVDVTDSLASDPYKSWQSEIDPDSGFGRHYEEDENYDAGSSAMASSEISPETKQTEKEVISNTYWPDQLSPSDFRGKQGIMCVGNAYTIAKAIPLALDESSDHEHTGPFAEYRAELGIESNSLRFRIKLDYSILDKEDQEVPPLHLKSMTVCREMREMWPRNGRKTRSIADRMSTEALFGVPGADGGLYDPPPVGTNEQAGQYMLIDLDGRATVLFPYMMDQDPAKHVGNDGAAIGWVTSLDWTPGSMRYQVDRKVRGGAQILGLRTLELSEVQSVNADTYRPRDGGQDMRQ